jgi:hypothetical protein
VFKPQRISEDQDLESHDSHRTHDPYRRGESTGLPLVSVTDPSSFAPPPHGSRLRRFVVFPHQNRLSLSPSRRETSAAAAATEPLLVPAESPSRLVTASPPYPDPSPSPFPSPVSLPRGRLDCSPGFPLVPPRPMVHRRRN